MSQRDALRSELLDIIKTHKEGFASGSSESQRIDALIDELSPLTPYPGALNHPEVFNGHWSGDYYNLGKLVGGSSAHNQGVGVTTSLKVFSMGRLPDVSATFLGSGLEIDPESESYNFYSRFAIGENPVETHHFTYGRYEKREENEDRFFVEFDRFELVPVDPDMSLDEYCAATGIEKPEDLSASMTQSPKLWSHVAYMDDDMRIQLGQLGGHYIMFRTDRPMYSLEHASGKTVTPEFIAAQ